MIDHPYDKATSEFIVTTGAKYQVVANGLLQEETDLGDGRRRTHWKQSVPIALLDDLTPLTRDPWLRSLELQVDERLILGPLGPSTSRWFPGLRLDPVAAQLPATSDGQPATGVKLSRLRLLGWRRAQQAAVAAGWMTTVTVPGETETSWTPCGSEKTGVSSCSPGSRPDASTTGVTSAASRSASSFACPRSVTDSCDCCGRQAVP